MTESTGFPEPDSPGPAAAAAEPVPVADQRAAGVPPEQTVTIAEQKAGADLPPAAAELAKPAPEPQPDRPEPEFPFGTPGWLKELLLDHHRRLADLGG